MVSKKCEICGRINIKNVLIGKSFRIDVCSYCGNAFTVPSPDEKRYQNEDFHEQFKAEKVSDLPRQWRNSILIQCKLIENNFDKNIKILEIGCGQGLMLKELQDSGYNVMGIEPSKTACENAKRKNINVMNSYFPTKLITDKFDLIIISHVLEHIKEYGKFLDSLPIISKNKCCLLITQTNYKGLIPVMQKENWYAWVPEQHYWHFTSSGLMFVLKEKGYKKMKLIRSSLVHGLTLATVITELFPFLGDQFHLLVRYERKN
ncbi:MAG: Methyltransferase type 11 [Candidatus Shapirobacteria bacterium GW2011_GWE1_38_92]|uniref:Methyltransferase type 11 n=3 Tax=Candidatus Shapironibacteriota TaxID=1752721 RepID=A0A0G0K7C7_9BACT|nr:MAG: Methyltransferase type 11 [Candidatus Shapirobacteria bacterium GW2011_GWE2_38_30]KKQ92837.1 MAG: Methyltransferase type 11 [Candidatus Shapirobacteria bacterium GW2011_GWE1_38_92]OGL56312.1 MAG: hypothetical protein A2367_03370 [Candidatus Shapirobacteria bacterium RIFOXYB1_FULL_38_38]